MKNCPKSALTAGNFAFFCDRELVAKDGFVAEQLQRQRYSTTRFSAAIWRSSSVLGINSFRILPDTATVFTKHEHHDTSPGDNAFEVAMGMNNVYSG